MICTISKQVSLQFWINKIYFWFSKVNWRYSFNVIFTDVLALSDLIRPKFALGISKVSQTVLELYAVKKLEIISIGSRGMSKKICFRHKSQLKNQAKI